MLRVAINGFGRIGRNAFKVALEKHSDAIEIVAINDLTSPEVLAHLLKYDSAYGAWDHEVSAIDAHLPGGNELIPGAHLEGGAVLVDNKKYPILTEKEPARLPWKDLDVDVVIESTGRFTDAEGMKQHLIAGAKKVVLSAPAKHTSGESKPSRESFRLPSSGPPEVEVGTYLIGVNAADYKGEQLVNNASCTTNCIAPVVAIIDEVFGVAKAVMTTVHGVTAEQNLVDGPPPGGKSSDLRRARAAYVNIIPTSTGAAIATTEVLPQLKGLFDGKALRVPVITGSISDITMVLKKKTTVEEVNQAIKKASEDPKWKGIVAWSDGALVSTDIIGRSESAIVDLPLTQVVGGDLVKIFAWYDNEWGYSNRLIEQVINVGSR